MAPSKVVMWGSPNIQAGLGGRYPAQLMRGRLCWYRAQKEGLSFPRQHQSHGSSSWSNCQGVLTVQPWRSSPQGPYLQHTPPRQEETRHSCLLPRPHQPMLMGWNRKSHSPCCQEQGQDTWFQPHWGHWGCLFNHCRHLRR